MDDNTSIRLVARWRKGDQEAADALFHRYAEQLVALAAGQLSAKLANRFDAEDVVQSAYRSFFIAARDGQFDLQRGGDLWRLLVTLTLHKLHDQVKHNIAQKRSVNREQYAGAPLDGMNAFLARGPSPLEAVTLADEVEEIMHRLDSVQRRMFEQRLQGYTLEEIAGETRRSMRTVCRVLDRIKLELEQRGSS